MEFMIAKLANLSIQKLLKPARVQPGYGPQIFENFYPVRLYKILQKISYKYL